MNRITTSMVQRNILADLNMVNVKLSKTQEQAASGRSINRPSDDPFMTARALSLSGSLAGNQQYQRNIDDARGWQDATEAALNSMTSYVQRAKDLLVGGATDTSDQGARDADADEIDQIIQGLKENANATYNGSYVFGGTTTGAPPYHMDSDDNYYGDTAGSGASVGVLREIGPGVTLSINTVGQDFLGNGQPAPGNPGDDKLLNVLRDISAHLRAGDSTSLRGTDMSRLDANLDDVLAVRARNGAQSNRLDAATSRLQDLETATTKQLSDTQDADFTQTMMNLNTQSAAYQAALRAGATIVQSSLMDFLK